MLTVAGTHRQLPSCRLFKGSPSHERNGADRLKNRNWELLAMSSPCLLLLVRTGSYRLAAYLKAAQAMSVTVLIASEGQYSLISEVHAGIHINFANPEQALARLIEIAQQRPINGVLGSDDSTVELAARLAQHLDLIHNDPIAAELTQRKDKAHQYLALHGCAVPEHHLINLNVAFSVYQQHINYPCVLKPLMMSGSRGVMRIDHPDQFPAACERLRRILKDEKDRYAQQHVLCEDYIDGIEVAYEGYLHQGQLHTLALFDKPEPLIGPYFEETIYVTPSALDQAQQDLIKQRVAEACQVYGLRTGAVHAELRLNEQDAWILEVASRTIGGDCARSLDTGERFGLEKRMIALALGYDLPIALPQNARGVMMIPVKKSGLLRRVEGISDARSVAYIERVDIIIRSGHELKKLPEEAQYVGYIFAQAPTSGQVTQALQQAYRLLNIVVAPVMQLTPI